MKSLQSQIEQFYSEVILKRPLLFAVLMLALVAVFGMHATNYKVDASADTLVLEGDKDLEFFREISRRYKSEDFLIIAYQPAKGLLEDETLNAISSLVGELQAVDGVSSVVSIMDAPLLYSPKIAISDISKGIPTLRNESVDRQLVEKELIESPIYNRLLSSVDGDTTAIQVNLRSDQRYIDLLEAREQLRARVKSGDVDESTQDELKAAEQAFKQYSTVATERHQALVANVRLVLEQHRDDYQHAVAQIYLGGVPMIASDMVDYVKSDLVIFGGGVLVFMVVLLAVIFRASRWVILPVIACVAVNIFMLGYLGWLDWRMTVVSSNFVALMLILSLAISIHLIVRYRELEMLNPAASRRSLAAKAVALMASPCVFTALTTLVAFVSLVISGIRPIIDFGLMMMIGIIAALLFAFLIVPLGMVLMPAGWVKNRAACKEETDSDELITEAGSDSGEGAFTLRFAQITEKYGRSILWVSAILVVLSFLGITRLEVENRFIDYFDESTEIYQGMELIDAELGGTIPLDIILFSTARGGSAPLVDDSFSDEGDEFADDEFEDDFADDFDADFDDEFGGASEEAEAVNQWFTRAGLQKIEEIHEYIDSLEETGKVLSLATIYQVAGDLLGGNVDDIQLSLAYKSLPDSIQKILVTPYLNIDSDEARINVRVKETSRTLNRAELLALLDNYLQTEIGLKAEDYRLSGMLVLYNNMLQSLFKSQILTLGVVFVAITAMLSFLFRSLLLGVLAVAPNLLAALIVLGGMGWAGLPLDMMTITIAAISIGIGVDDTIHYVHRFKLEFQQDRNYLNTMYRCHGSIGRAMYYTSVTIIFGFSILTLSNFKPSIYFGLLTGAAMFSALIGALLLLPRLIIVFKPFGPEQELAEERAPRERSA